MTETDMLKTVDANTLTEFIKISLLESRDMFMCQGSTDFVECQ